MAWSLELAAPMSTKWMILSDSSPSSPCSSSLWSPRRASSPPSAASIHGGVGVGVSASTHPAMGLATRRSWQRDNPNNQNHIYELSVLLASALRQGECADSLEEATPSAASPTGTHSSSLPT